MAIPQGNYTALQRLRPIQEGFGEIIQDGVDDIIAREEAERAEAQKQEDERKAISDQFGEDYTSLVDVVTKTKSIDQAFARGINSARDEMGITYKALSKNPALANNMDMQIKMQNLKGFSKNLKLISDRYTEYASKLATGMQDGTLSQWNSNALSDMDSVFSQANLDVRVDKKTGLPIAVIAELDDNGKPTGQLKELNLVEVLDGRGMTQTVPRFDFEKSVTTIGDKLGKREVKEPGSNFTHIEYQQFEDIEQDVRKMVRGFIGNESNPTDTAKSIWSDAMGMDPKKLTASDMQAIEDYYTNSIRGFYDEKNKKTVDYSARNTAQKNYREQQEKRGRGLQLRTDTFGRPLREGLPGVSGDIGGSAYSFTMPKRTVVGVKGENREIASLYLTDSGAIAYEQNVYIGKDKGNKIDPSSALAISAANGTLGENEPEVIIKTITGGGLSDPELNDIAVELGYNNAGELRKALEEVAQEGTGSPQVKEAAKSVDTSKYNQ